MRQFLDHGSLSRAADSQVADAYHGAADLMVPEQMGLIKAKAQENNRKVKKGNSQQQNAQDARAFSGATLQNDIDCKLFETVEKTPHFLRAYQGGAVIRGAADDHLRSLGGASLHCRGDLGS